MTLSYIKINGDKISKDALKLSNSKDFLNAVLLSTFCTYVDTFSYEQKEIIIIDVEVELPQRPINDIRKKERLAVHFLEGVLPRVYTLRSDFPLVPHINLTIEEFPRSMCIYENSYNELKLHWTGPKFLEDIRNWLALTAKGKLHAEDQFLEPLLAPTTKILIIPFKTIAEHISHKPVPLYLTLTKNSNGLDVFFLENTKQSGKSVAMFVIVGKTQKHGLMRKSPNNLFEFHRFLETANLNLVNELRIKLKEWKDDNELNGITAAQLVILCVLPKGRKDNLQIETLDLYAFYLNNKISEIGQEIGAWEIFDNKIADLIGVTSDDGDKNGDNLFGELLNPIYSFDKTIAQTTSGAKTEVDPFITAVGLGAIGSQVFMNFIRMGIGRWNLIDNDIILPHNLARHTLLNADIGHSKVDRLMQNANSLYRECVVNSYNANIFNPGTLLNEITKAYKEANIILDMSASIPVARKLTVDIESKAKRISAFLNPSGYDCILLSEDSERKSRLDYLEMVYYRYLIQNDDLRDHLITNKERMRYGNSCRNISFQLSQDIVSIHAGILTRAITEEMTSNESRITIWKTNLEDISVKSFNCDIGNCINEKIGDWHLLYDNILINKLKEFRRSKLPNETGGVLIGCHDIQRKIIYIVDTIPSPKDSLEWPTIYIRGCHGLLKQFEEIKNITGNNLYYIGEWHSHPKGASCKPSSDDKKAFEWLANIMSEEGYPALMMIISERFGLYIGEMK